MAKAHVVFADGSKAAAHNLDDLRERWLLRKQAYEYAAQLKPQAVWNIDYSHIETLGQAQALREQIKDQVGQSQAQLTASKVDVFDKYPNKQAYYAYREMLTAQQAYLHGLLRHIKSRMIELSRLDFETERADEPAFIRKLCQDLGQRNKRIKQLTRLLKENGIPIPEEETNERQ